VQLPFLQVLMKKFEIVPIVLSEGSRKEYAELGRIIASAIKETGRNAMIIASSDMTHYEPADIAKKKDKMALDEFLKMDPDGFLDVVERENISMCGYIPAAVMLSACIEAGANNAVLTKYQTSGDVSGDNDAVVGYAGAIVY